MKNKLIYTLTALALFAIVWSCNTLENTPQFANSKTALTITPSATTITPTVADSATAVLTVSWNNPKLSVGVANTLFTLYLSPTGTDFATFTSKTFNGVLSGSLLGKELNGMAAKLGGKVGQAITLDAKVVASQENNNNAITSNTVQITFSPYGDLSFAISSITKVLSAANASNPADTLTWSTAFKGYSGVVTYQIQYAKGGTSFAAPTSTSVTSFSQVYTVVNLNNIAIGVGASTGVATPVDFRIMATNEQGNSIYSNVVTITITPYAANNSIGLIGDATAGGWSVDTDMYRLDPINAPGAWTLITYLNAATYGVKFRADDAWTIQWGGSSFPSGIGTQAGGNIPLTTAGYYKIDFNAGTGAYSFTLLSPPTFTNISLIGDFNSWSADDDLTPDASGHIWTGTVSIASAGGIKFRANHAWTTSWASATSPSGYASTSAPGNINIAAGNYFVYFNDVSGEFMFGNTAAATPFTPIGVVGDATPNGWNGPDIAMIQNPTNPYKWSVKAALVGGKSAKFRVNNDWTTNWGGNSFPSGIAGLGSSDNIPVQTSYTYQITFNSLTGEYKFWN
ncbi:MAG: SusE domain-containing protein [Bacteroidetes bacterium]|nr:SusE domain-containing protein [Bacteroidota bacterium]